MVDRSKGIRPVTWAPLRARLIADEDRLVDALRDHRARLAEPVAATSNTFLAGGEGAPADMDDEREVALLARIQQRLDEIRAALTRIEDGRFGECERCGEAVEAERLRAMPEARLCHACQLLAEGPGQ